MKLRDKTNSITPIAVERDPLRHSEIALCLGSWPTNRAARRSAAAVANMTRSGVLSGPFVCEKSAPKRNIPVPRPNRNLNLDSLPLFRYASGSTGFSTRIFAPVSSRSRAIDTPCSLFRWTDSGTGYKTPKLSGVSVLTVLAFGPRFSGRNRLRSRASNSTTGENPVTDGTIPTKRASQKSSLSRSLAG